MCNLLSLQEYYSESSTLFRPNRTRVVAPQAIRRQKRLCGRSCRIAWQKEDETEGLFSGAIKQGAPMDALEIQHTQAVCDSVAHEQPDVLPQLAQR